MENNHIPYFEDEDSKLRDGLPVVERETINAILWNPDKDEILCLDWEEFGWHTFVIGGVEDNEDLLETAIREIKEETGYGDIELVSNLGQLRSGYYAAHKNQNRIANTTGFLFKLKSELKDEVDQSYLPHVFRWIPKNGVVNFINLSSQKYLWEKALKII